jgi:hypothetical protein
MATATRESRSTAAKRARLVPNPNLRTKVENLFGPNSKKLMNALRYAEAMRRHKAGQRQTRPTAKYHGITQTDAEKINDEIFKRSR